MTEQERLLAALEYQEAQRPALMNPNLMRQGQRMNLPARQAPGPMAEFVTQAMSLDPQPDQGLGTVGAEMGLSLFPGVGQAMGLRDVERGRRANDPVMMGLGAASLIPVGKLISALRGGKQMGPVSELDVYHGSPHKMAPTESNPLGEFDPTKIGTGEGAQAYGYGHYLAESQKVAKSYADDLSKAGGNPLVVRKGGSVFKEGDALTSEILDALKYREMGLKDAGQFPHNTDYYAAKRVQSMPEGPYRDRVMASLDELKGTTSAYEKKTPFLYKADLPDEQIAKMLDWDKPLSQQPESARKALSKFVDSLDVDNPGHLRIMSKLDNPRTQNVKFGDLYNEISGALWGRGDNAEFSKKLAEAGIPGIRYLDGGSRAGGAGTSNFVVFPGGEKMLNILERQ